MSKILLTICARAGSKGVVGKNIRLMHGQPLIGITIKQAIEWGKAEKIIVSTDSREIAEIAIKYGAEVPFIRPSKLANDGAPKLPVLQHATKYCIQNLDYTPDYVIDLDPTSPLRSIEDIQNCYDRLINDPPCDSVFSVYKSVKNPYFNMVEISNLGNIQLCKTLDKWPVRRQDAPDVYSINASVYAWKTKDLLNRKEVISGIIKIVEMPYERSIDIDNETDWEFVEYLMSKKDK